MEEKTKLTVGMIITMVALLSGTYYITLDDDAYHCESKDLVMICEKLSSGLGTRCYFEDTYKICSEGWQKLETGAVTGPEELYEAPEPANGKKWSCNPEGCVAI